MAQIDPAVYPSKYKISHQDRNGSDVIEFSDDIAQLLIDGKLTFETYMNGSNSYCGFNPSTYGYWQSGGASFGVIKGDSVTPDHFRAQSGITSANGKMNYRWMLKVLNTGSAPQGGMIMRWTPQKPPVDSIGTIYNPSYNARERSLLDDKDINIPYGNTYSMFYNMYPITNINIDKIQLDPVFYFLRIVPTYTDDYISSIRETSISYRWQDIKPEDKTPAGVHYNQDLWEHGWYDEIDEQTGKISARMICVSCNVHARYGSYKYNISTFGAKNSIFATRIDSADWNSDGDRVLPNTGFSTPIGYLVPVAETPFNINEQTGVLLQTLAGLDFCEQSASRSTSNSSVPTSFQYSTAAMAIGRYAGVSYQGNTLTATTSHRSGAFKLAYAIGDMENSMTLISNGIGDLVDAEVECITNKNEYIFNNDGSLLFHNTLNTGYVYATPFSLQSLWATLASLGVWIITDFNALPDDFELGVDFPTNVYRGEVLADGTTTGRMFQGDDAEQEPWDNIDYEPVIPTPTPPGPPEGEESGDRIPNNERYFSGAYNFITQYAMTRQQLGQFGNLLWTSWADQQGITDMWKNFKMFISSDPASDTGSIDIASVMDFILSLQVFPFDLSSLLHTDSANVCIGTGQYPLAVSGKKLLTINHILDCGTMAIPRPYNDFRDYENMSITAYLPYCGSVELNPGDVVGRSVSIEYSVDTLSGSCTAVLTAYDDDGYLYNVGMINGQISASIPMTATNSGQIRAQRISDVASLAGLAGNTFLGNITQGSSINPSGVDSNPIGAISSLATGTVNRSFNSAMSAQQMFANRFSRGAISCPTLAGGNGIAAFFQPACPYIQMRYGLYQKPDNYDHSVGGVSATSAPLSSYAGSGFTVCENVDISGFTCHEEERSAIKALLESGVYL